MTETHTDQIANSLAAARLSGLPAVFALPWQPADLPQAYRLQQAVASRLGRVAGWKVSALSAGQQRQMGVQAPVAGPLLAPWSHDSGVTLSRAAFNRAPLIECEFAFVLGEDLPCRDTAYSRAEVEAAIASVHPALEICDSRLAQDASTLQQLVDGFNNGAFVLGPPSERWRDIDYRRHEAVLFRDDPGQRLAHGTGAAILDGDPVAAVVAMVNLRPAPWEDLRAGQVITTGTCTQPFTVRENGTYVGDFGSLGQVAVRLEDF